MNTNRKKIYEIALIKISFIKCMLNIIMYVNIYGLCLINK